MGQDGYTGYKLSVFMQSRNIICIIFSKESRKKFCFLVLKNRIITPRNYGWRDRLFVTQSPTDATLAGIISPLAKAFAGNPIGFAETGASAVG